MRIVRLWVVALLCVGWGQWGCYEYGPYNVPYVPCTVGDTASIVHCDTSFSVPIQLNICVNTISPCIESVLVVVNDSVWGLTDAHGEIIRNLITDSLPFKICVFAEKDGYEPGYRCFWQCEKNQIKIYTVYLSPL